jgi:hypothetical protein
VVLVVLELQLPLSQLVLVAPSSAPAGEVATGAMRRIDGPGNERP